MQVWVKRFLLAAIFINLYLLVLAWQKDFPQKQSTNTVASPAAVAQDVHAAGSDVPPATAAPTIKPASADLPIATVSTPATSTDQPAAVAMPASTITVESDIYKIWIDLQGGDVVRAELKQVLNNLSQPSPLVLLVQSPTLSYVAQSGLIGVNGPDSQGRPLYSSSSKSFMLADGQDTLSVPLTLTMANGVQVTKTFVFKRAQYPIQLDMTVNNLSPNPWQGQFFAQLKRDNSKDPSQSTQGIGGLATFLGAAWGSETAAYNRVKLQDFATENPNVRVVDGYISMVQHYFLSAWIPSKGSTHQFSTRDANGSHIISMLGDNVSISPQSSKTFSATLYAGPKNQKVLKGLAHGLDQTVDYGWLWPIAKLLFWGLQFLHGLIGNWGWAIIALTLVVKMLLYPLSAKSYRSMAKMKKITPLMVELKDKYGDDRAGFAQAMMDMYKKEQVNPLSGCMPMLLQMPIFLALYWVLMESVELRHAPWMLWIQDLSAMDKWFILPLIMGVTMYVQQMLDPQPADPMQAKMMKMMPIIFTAFLLFFPAGLVLYWIANNLISIAQQWYVTRQVEKNA